MFPAFKRAITTPWRNYHRKLQLIKNIREPLEIMKEMHHFNSLSLEAEAKGKKEQAKEFRVMCETLQWVLKVGNVNTK